MFDYEGSERARPCESSRSVKKSTLKTSGCRKTPTRHNEKAPPGPREKMPGNYTPMLGVVTKERLRSILLENDQREWCTRVRLLGLLSLIDLILRKLAKQPEGVSMPADLADGYISKLGRAKSSRTIREPLPLLCKIGLLMLVRKAVNGWHLKTSAIYSIHPDFSKTSVGLSIYLTPCLARKRTNALMRQEKRLNEKYPYRESVLDALLSLGISKEGRRCIAELSVQKNFESAVKQTVAAIDLQKHSVRVSARGQITTSIGRCPKVLKPFLEIDSELTFSCDISHAHHCFLPRMLSDRMRHVCVNGGLAGNVRGAEVELTRLISFLSEGDYYQKWCADSCDVVERASKKRTINMMLNLPTSKALCIPLYKKMKREFPHTFRVVEDIKSGDHRHISIQTQHFTAKVISQSLLEMQKHGILGIPDVDSIICQSRHREFVCQTIGRYVHEVSGGVQCKVGGIRYDPLVAIMPQLSPTGDIEGCG